MTSRSRFHSFSVSLSLQLAPLLSLLLQMHFLLLHSAVVPRLDRCWRLLLAHRKNCPNTPNANERTDENILLASVDASNGCCQMGDSRWTDFNATHNLIDC